MKDRMFELLLAGLGLVLAIQVYTLTSINGRIDGLSTNLQDVDRRLARIEGAYSCRDHFLAKEKSE